MKRIPRKRSGRALGPLRRIVGFGVWPRVNKRPDGSVTVGPPPVPGELLECGHAIGRPQDIYGPTFAVRRRCWRCRKEMETLAARGLIGGKPLQFIGRIVELPGILSPAYSSYSSEKHPKEDRMPETSELADREFLMEELKLKPATIAAVASIVGEPLEVEERSPGLYGLAATEGASALDVADLVGLFDQDPVCSFTDNEPPGEDDLFSILAVFVVESTDGETYAVSVRFEHGAGSYENCAYVDIAVPTDEERGTRSAVARAAKAVEIDMLRKSWTRFAEVAAECRHADLRDIAPANEWPTGTDAAVALVEKLPR